MNEVKTVAGEGSEKARMGVAEDAAFVSKKAGWKKPNQVKCHAKDPNNCRFHHTGKYANMKGKKLFTSDKSWKEDPSDIQSFLEEQAEAAGVDAGIAVTLDKESGKYKVDVTGNDIQGGKALVDDFLYDLGGELDCIEDKGPKAWVDEDGKSMCAFKAQEESDTVESPAGSAGGSGEEDEDSIQTEVGKGAEGEGGGGAEFTDADSKLIEELDKGLSDSGLDTSAAKWGKLEDGTLTLTAGAPYFNVAEIEDTLKYLGYGNMQVWWDHDNGWFGIAPKEGGGGEASAAGSGEAEEREPSSEEGDAKKFGVSPDGFAYSEIDTAIKGMVEDVVNDDHGGFPNGVEWNKDADGLLTMKADGLDASLASEFEASMKDWGMEHASAWYDADKGVYCVDPFGGQHGKGAAAAAAGAEPTAGEEGKGAGEESAAAAAELALPKTSQFNKAYDAIGELIGHTDDAEAVKEASAAVSKHLGVEVDLSGLHDSDLESIASELEAAAETENDPDMAEDAMAYFKNALKKMGWSEKAHGDGDIFGKGDGSVALTKDEVWALETGAAAAGWTGFGITDKEDGTYIFHDWDDNGAAIDPKKAIEQIASNVNLGDTGAMDENTKETLKSLFDKAGVGAAGAAGGETAQGTAEAAGAAAAEEQPEGFVAAEDIQSGNDYAAAAGGTAKKKVDSLHKKMSDASALAALDPALAEHIEGMDYALSALDFLQQKMDKAKGANTKAGLEHKMDVHLAELSKLEGGLAKAKDAAAKNVIHNADETVADSLKEVGEALKHGEKAHGSAGEFVDALNAELNAELADGKKVDMDAPEWKGFFGSVKAVLNAQSALNVAKNAHLEAGLMFNALGAKKTAESVTSACKNLVAAATAAKAAAEGAKMLLKHNAAKAAAVAKGASEEDYEKAKTVLENAKKTGAAGAHYHTESGFDFHQNEDGTLVCEKTAGASGEGGAATGGGSGAAPSAEVASVMQKLSSEEGKSYWAGYMLGKFAKGVKTAAATADMLSKHLGTEVTEGDLKAMSAEDVNAAKDAFMKMDEALDNRDHDTATALCSKAMGLLKKGAAGKGAASDPQLTPHAQNFYDECIKPDFGYFAGGMSGIPKEAIEKGLKKAVSEFPDSTLDGDKITKGSPVANQIAAKGAEYAKAFAAAAPTGGAAGAGEASAETDAAENLELPKKWYWNSFGKTDASDLAHETGVTTKAAKDALLKALNDMDSSDLDSYGSMNAEAEAKYKALAKQHLGLGAAAAAGTGGASAEPTEADKQKFVEGKNLNLCKAAATNFVNGTNSAEQLADVLNANGFSVDAKTLKGMNGFDKLELSTFLGGAAHSKSNGNHEKAYESLKMAEDLLAKHGGEASAAPKSVAPAGYNHETATPEQKGDLFKKNLEAKIAAAKDPKMKATYEKVLAKYNAMHGGAAAAGGSGASKPPAAGGEPALHEKAQKWWNNWGEHEVHFVMEEEQGISPTAAEKGVKQALAETSPSGFKENGYVADGDGFNKKSVEYAKKFDAAEKAAKSGSGAGSGAAAPSSSPAAGGASALKEKAQQWWDNVGANEVDGFVKSFDVSATAAEKGVKQAISEMDESKYSPNGTTLAASFSSLQDIEDFMEKAKDYAKKFDAEEKKGGASASPSADEELSPLAQKWWDKSGSFYMDQVVNATGVDTETAQKSLKAALKKGEDLVKVDEDGLYLDGTKGFNLADEAIKIINSMKDGGEKA